MSVCVVWCWSLLSVAHWLCALREGRRLRRVPNQISHPPPPPHHHAHQVEGRVCVVSTYFRGGGGCEVCFVSVVSSHSPCLRVLSSPVDFPPDQSQRKTPRNRPTTHWQTRKGKGEQSRNTRPRSIRQARGGRSVYTPPYIFIASLACATSNCDLIHSQDDTRRRDAPTFDQPDTIIQRWSHNHNIQ